MKHLTPVWFGIMLSSGLIASSTIVATALHNFPAQHLTIAEASSLTPASLVESQGTSISTEQSAQLTNALIGIICAGLPCSLLFVVVLQQQLAARQARLAAQLVRVRVDSK
jgi:hypothetical protein